MPWDKAPYSWRRPGADAAQAHDSAALLPDWKHFDEFVERAPRVEDLDFSKAVERARRAREEGRYVMAAYWRLFFERPWGIRGMQNLMLDYYDRPEMVHRLHRYLADTYKAIYRRTREELGPDGFQSSDDLGNQRALNVSPEIFREFMLPYYRETVGECRRLGMHFWLHSCGNNTDAMEMLIDSGVTMFHPVQKHTMDWPKTARSFGGRIGWWAGFDVQHLLQEGTPDQVRAEVREMVRLFSSPDGGLVLAAGNGITGTTPLANIEAFLDEAHRAGR
jgi:uroporphyrinogen decarboxylase